MKAVLVTGASGFVGSALVPRLQRQLGVTLRIAVRPRAEGQPPELGGVETIPVGDLAPNTDWTDAVCGVDAVVHAAARVHVMSESASDSLSAFRRANVEGTLALAHQAAKAGVRRFIFVSSIKVNGEGTTPGRPYTADDTPAPSDPYGISKYEAEQGLRRVSEETGLEVVIIRPVLVYGPGVKANFHSMMRWLHRGVPLPLGAIHNLRSLVALENLVDLIVTCVRHPAAAAQTFLVSDGDDLSTTALLRRTAAALGTRAHLIPVPEMIVRATARVLGRADLERRLCGSLQVDIRKTCDLLGWAPPLSVDEALKRTAQHFLA